MSLTGRSRRGAVSFSIFEEYHESMLQLERSYHAAGVAVEFYETINEKMERTVVLINSLTKTPYKSVVVEGKSSWQAIRDVVEQVQEQYGYEAPGAVPASLRARIAAQMREKCITETRIAEKAGCSIAFVSHFLKGRRSSPNILAAISELLGYKTVEEMVDISLQKPGTDKALIAASRGHDGGTA